MKNTSLTISRPTISLWCFGFLLMGAFFSYFTSGNDIVKLLGYLLAFLGFAGLLTIWPLVSKTRLAIAGVFCWLMGVFAILPMFQQGQVISIPGFVQTLIYPFVTFILTVVGYRLIESRPNKLARFIVFLALMNGAVALSASLGFLNELPLIGEIKTGRYIFGTTIPSSTGLVMNVNYYSTVQGVFFWLYLGLRKMSFERLTRSDWLILLVIFFTALLGSSRGVLAALVVSIIGYLLLTALCGPVLKRRFAWISVILAVVFFIWITQSHWDYIYQALRIGKGLNYRDVLWSAALDLWLEKPILGWGSYEGLSLGLEEMADRAGSVHSGYLHTLYRGGLLLFSATYGFIAFGVLYGLRFSKEKWYKNRWAVSLIVFFLVNAAVRTFSVGGLGLLPVAFGIALSVCFYADII